MVDGYRCVLSCLACMSRLLEMFYIKLVEKKIYPLSASNLHALNI
jgi:hypothetical protein